ncbi:MAG: hypothetical protein EPN23_01505 [Verrucomicrobia bacterium]|nr:MAG: hypothetical protein EPN23_01505 [Verrucomicrobiota bacterium]
MMGVRFKLLPVIIGYVLACLYFAIQLAGGLSFMGAAKIMLILMPMVLGLLLSLRTYWLSLVLACCMWNYRLNFPLFDILFLGFIVAFLIFILVLGEACINKVQPVHIREMAGVWPILAMGVIICGRFLYDRPGSARIGGVGGIGQAIYYAFGVFAFWTALILARRTRPTRGIIGLMMGIGLIAFTHQQYLNIGGEYGLLATFFERPMWLVAPVVLAGLYYKRFALSGWRPSWFLLYGVILFLLVIPCFSAFRSRLYFAATMILVVAYVFRQSKKALVYILVIGVLGIGAILLGYGHLPGRMGRALSTLVSADRIDRSGMAEYNLSGEVGWESGFRAAMNKVGWRKIMSSPIIGVGFNFSFEEIITQLSFERTNLESEVLAMGGGYHDALLALAVFCGLPAAFLFVIGYVWIVWLFVGKIYALSPSLEKWFGASLLGILMPVTGQMLMNGVGHDFMTVCIVLGAMSGYGGYLKQCVRTSLIAE